MAPFCTDLTTNSNFVRYSCFETVAVTDVWHCLCYLMGQSRQMLWASWLGKKPPSITVEFTFYIPLYWGKCFKWKWMVKSFLKSPRLLRLLLLLQVSEMYVSKSSRCFWGIIKFLTSESKFGTSFSSYLDLSLERWGKLPCPSSCLFLFRS